jgi:hypothetical protein
MSVIYLDGQRAGASVMSKLSPDTIASVSVLKDGDIARQLGPDEARLGVLFITTKTGQRTHRVRAFNRRLARLRRAQVRAASA